MHKVAQHPEQIPLLNSVVKHKGFTPVIVTDHTTGVMSQVAWSIGDDGKMYRWDTETHEWVLL